MNKCLNESSDWVFGQTKIEFDELSTKLSKKV